MKQKSLLFVFLSSLLCISCHDSTAVVAFHLPSAATSTITSTITITSRGMSMVIMPRSTSTLHIQSNPRTGTCWRSKELKSKFVSTSSTSSSTSKKSLLLLSSYNTNSIDTNNNNNHDPVMRKVAIRLRRANWISWWAQVILTVISSITLLFARSVLNALSTATTTAPAPPGGFLFAGSGIVLSYLSIIWTWGGTRLSRRIFRSSITSTSTSNNMNNKSNANANSNNTTKIYSRIKAASTIRQVILIGTMLNLFGMFVTLIGAEQIVGLLAAKVLTAQGGFGLLGGAATGFQPLSVAQSIQPLDVLIVQANTNTLLSHFLSLVCCLFLTRSVHDLDPPSVEDDER